jgi:hypothetical protein
MIEHQIFDLFDRLPTQTKAGIIGGMVSPAIVLVWLLFYETLGNRVTTGLSLLFAFSIFWVFLGALVGAVGGTIIGTAVKVMKMRLEKDGDQIDQRSSTSSPRLWHDVYSSEYKTSRNNVWTWVKENSTMICGFVGGLLFGTTLPFWLFVLS